MLRHDTVSELLDTVIGSLRGDRTGKARMPNIVPMSLSLWAGIYQVLFAFKLGVPVVLMDAVRTGRVRPARARVRHQVVGAAAGRARDAVAGPGDHTLEPLRYVRSVSAPLSPAYARRFHDRFGIAILNGYGQTELGGEAVGWTADDWKAHGLEKLGSVGRPHAAFQLRVRGADGELAPTDEVGELEIHSTSALPPADAAMEGRVTDDGWLRTGDLARIDAEGFVWIRGRVSAMINRGGLKVFPDEVEEQLRAHDASTTSRSPASPTIGSARCRGRSSCRGPARRSTPKRCGRGAATAWRRTRSRPGVTIVDALPRNEIGKVLRQELVRDNG